MNYQIDVTKGVIAANLVARTVLTGSLASDIGLKGEQYLDVGTFEGYTGPVVRVRQTVPTSPAASQRNWIKLGGHLSGPQGAPEP